MRVARCVCVCVCVRIASTLRIFCFRNGQTTTASRRWATLHHGDGWQVTVSHGLVRKRDSLSGRDGPSHGGRSRRTRSGGWEWNPVEGGIRSALVCSALACSARFALLGSGQRVIRSARVRCQSHPSQFNSVCYLQFNSGLHELASPAS